MCDCVRREGGEREDRKREKKKTTRAQTRHEGRHSLDMRSNLNRSRRIAELLSETHANKHATNGKSVSIV